MQKLQGHMLLSQVWRILCLLYMVQCAELLTRNFIFEDDVTSDAFSDLESQLCCIYPLVHEDISAQQKH